MVDIKSDDKQEACCKKEQSSQEKKLVKATDLPIYGEPYPPKDVVITDQPGMLESKVATVRNMLQPYVSPIGVAYEKTSDVVSIGIAHSQSSLQRLAENQSIFVNSSIIVGSALLGYTLTRRSGYFKRLGVASVCLTGAFGACYPKETMEKVQVFWYIGKNILPVIARQQYEKLTQNKTQQTNTEPKALDPESKS